MKKFNIVFLFIVLLFIGLSKNVNINTNNKTSKDISNVSSNTLTNSDSNIPYIDNSLITFTVNGDGTTATISDIDASNLEGVVYIPSTVEKDNKQYIVTALTAKRVNGMYSSVFGSGTGDSGQLPLNTKITGIVIPNTVTSLLDNTFVGLSAVKSMIIPESVTNLANTFVIMASLEEVYFLGNVTNFPAYLFNKATSLKNIYYFGNGILSWPSGDPFSGTSGVRMYFKNSDAYSKTITAKGSNSSVVTLVSSDFQYQYSSEKKLIYSTTDKKIIKSTLYELENDTLIPAKIDKYTITTIGSTAFLNNLFIQNVVFEDGITTIEDGTTTAGAFVGCSNLKTVTLSNTLTKIGNSAFTDIHQNTIFNSGVLPDSITTIGDYAFSGVYIEELTLGKGLTSIGTTAFGFNEFLKKIYVNSKITTVGTDLFGGSTANTAVIIEFSNKELYNNNSTLVSKYLDNSTYPISVQYQNVGLINNPSFTTEFQSEINQKNPVEDEN